MPNNHRAFWLNPTDPLAMETVTNLADKPESEQDDGKPKMELV